jgi:hypothetical protein
MSMVMVTAIAGSLPWLNGYSQAHLVFGGYADLVVA